MLGRLFSGSLGQFVAPDPSLIPSSSSPPNTDKNNDDGITVRSVSEDDDTASVVSSKQSSGRRRRTWMEILAPDPVYYSSTNEDGSSSDEDKESNNTPLSSPSALNASNDDDVSETIDFATPTSSKQQPQQSKNNKNTTPLFLATPPTLSTPPLYEDDDNDTNHTSSSSSKEQQELTSHVLCAARGTASSLMSPTNVWEKQKNFFQLCSSTRPLSQKQTTRLRNMLNRDPTLANSFITRMGPQVADGYMPLHAAAEAGNMEAVTLLLSLEHSHRVDLRATDQQGRTPLHVAAAKGHTEVVDFLKLCARDKEGVDPVGAHAPVDLGGRTPLAWACTSRDKKAVENRVELERALFARGDRSVCPVTPGIGRSSRKLVCRGSSGAMMVSPLTSCDSENDGSFGDNNNINNVVEYGYSEMPGFRVDMEDALCCHHPVPLKDRRQVGVFGVFDGHGDGGLGSRFIADNLLTCLQTISAEGKHSTVETVTDWTGLLTQVSLQLDTELKERKMVRQGGSTAIFAVLTEDSVVVANVGDSRAILVSSSKSSDSNVPLRVITPLSADHKPNLPKEQQRIRNAGLDVTCETHEGEVLHKVRLVRKGKTETSIAVSRAFGDFDFKANPELPAEGQALVCTPEVTMHELSSDGSNSRQLLILACDGVWDVMSNEEAGELVMELWEKSDGDDGGDTNNDRMLLSEVGDALLKECFERGSRDNMTVLIVSLPSIQKDGDDGTARRIFG